MIDGRGRFCCGRSSSSVGRFREASDKEPFDLFASGCKSSSAARFREGASDSMQPQQKKIRL
jgi:hypothetical protein